VEGGKSGRGIKKSTEDCYVGGERKFSGASSCGGRRGVLKSLQQGDHVEGGGGERGTKRFSEGVHVEGWTKNLHDKELCRRGVEDFKKLLEELCGGEEERGGLKIWLQRFMWRGGLKYFMIMIHVSGRRRGD
jgi:hypothetical protein